MIEPQFASVLRASSREISTLSPTLRSGWDGRPLAILTRTAPARASTAHISIIGHITQHELRRHTTSLELANGYINRVLLIACRRQRLLPEGGDPDPLAATGLTGCSQPPCNRHAGPGRSVLTRTRVSCGITPTASSPPSRPTGSSRRSPPALRRTSSVSRSSTPSPTANPSGAAHLTAALALQDYAARSAAWALTGATGDPLAEQIHAACTTSRGLTRSQISQTLHHNQPARQIDHALDALHAAGRVTSTQIPTGGRPAQLWTVRA